MDNHFKIIIPLYNVEKWIKICIRSVKVQNYKNFQCIILDDISTDNSVDIIKKEIENDNRFKLIVNTEKAFALKNIYDGIKLSNANPEDIIVTLDGDDWLASADVLNNLNKIYNKEKCWLTYGSYAEYPGNRRGKFAKQIPYEIIQAASYRKYEWCTSHLRTFKTHLWNKIKTKDLLDSEGNFYRMTWDLAFMFPMLEMAAFKSHYIKDIQYVYNLGNPLNDHKIDNTYQQSLEREIRSKTKYEPIQQNINFVDLNIKHANSYNDALEYGRPNNFLHYETDLLYKSEKYHSLNDVTIYTDLCLKKVLEVESKYNIAWLMEPRAFFPKCYEDIENLISNYDAVFTYDSKLFEQYPNKCFFTPADGVFVDTETTFKKNIKKEKMFSHIYSSKTQLEGHKFRHTIASHIKKQNLNVDLFGNGSPTPLDRKSDGLRPYKFSIVIENNRDKNYFTEKIIDAFICRTIPIYWGAPNISNWFDMGSIITFDTLEDLQNILSSLTEEDYQNSFDSLMENYHRSLEYYDYDKIIADNIFKFLSKHKKEN